MKTLENDFALDPEKQNKNPKNKKTQKLRLSAPQCTGAVFLLQKYLLWHNPPFTSNIEPLGTPIQLDVRVEPEERMEQRQFNFGRQN